MRSRSPRPIHAWSAGSLRSSGRSISHVRVVYGVSISNGGFNNTIGLVAYFFVGPIYGLW